MQFLECTDCYNDDTKDSYPYATASNVYQDYELVTCNFQMICPDNVQRQSCQWQRYFYFGCNGDWTFDVGTNSLPNHCYYTNSNPPIGSASTYDQYGYSNPWNIAINNMSDFLTTNKAVVSDYAYTTINTQTDVNTLCD